jgi:glycerol-3-phosphate O-acyltransferase
VEEVAELAATSGIDQALDILLEHGVVTCFENGREPVYSISRHNELVAAFYRNSVIHWFVNRSIAELALVRAAEEEPGSDQAEVAWSEAFRLRDVLKFEFFFGDRDRFRGELREELALIEPAWHSASEFTLADVGRALVDSGALMAHRVLSSFLESYRVVAECLLGHPVSGSFDQAAFLTDCLAFGQQLRLQHRITSGEAVSSELFRSALKLAENRGLLDSANPELGRGRAAFAAELRDLVRRIRVLAGINRAQQEAEGLVLAVAAGV